MDILPNRLAAVAAALEGYGKVADIGADHAHLSIYLVRQGLATQVIIGELADGPYRRARGAVEASGCADKIDVRQGNGLQVLMPGEVQTVVLAGLGGDTIVEILAWDWDKSSTFPRYLFQPMSKPEVLRRALAEQGWWIDREDLVAERGRTYLLIAASPGKKTYHLDELEALIGPEIIKADSDLKRRYLRKILGKWRQVERQLVESPQPDPTLLMDYRDKIAGLEEILNASQDK